MTIKVTPELVKEWSAIYVDDTDKRCPIPECRSKDLMVCEFDAPAHPVTSSREVFCQACQSTWRETFAMQLTLTGISQLKSYSDGCYGPFTSPEKGT